MYTATVTRACSHHGLGDDAETRAEQLRELQRAFPGWEIWSTGAT
jgi:hypothetical protein